MTRIDHMTHGTDCQLRAGLYKCDCGVDAEAADTIVQFRATIAQLRADLAEAVDALNNLKTAVATEVIFHGAGCTGEYVKAEDRARAIVDKHQPAEQTA